MKRLFSILAVLVLIMGMTACGNTKPSPEAEYLPSNSIQQTETEAENTNAEQGGQDNSIQSASDGAQIQTNTPDSEIENLETEVETEDIGMKMNVQMSSMEQMEDNISYMSDFQPLTEKEKELCYKVADIINGQIAIPCTGCSYCTEGCPMKIAIPQYFSLYNENMREDMAEKGWTASFANYDVLTMKFGKAKDCIECGQCEGVCPQHLPVIKNLKTVSKQFDH